MPCRASCCWCWRRSSSRGVRDRSRYEPKDTLTSLALGLGSTDRRHPDRRACSSRSRCGSISIACSTSAIPGGRSSLAFVLDDLGYYWVHRAGHRIRWAWAAHVIHHSSQHYNLSTALRQTWTGFFGADLHLQAAAVPDRLSAVPMLVFVGGINLIYQFWIHTEVIGRMPRWFEAVMNTPSHHRVHHATNPRYLDMNYAGRVHRVGQDVRHLHARTRRGKAALRHRQESGQLQPGLGGVPRMGRDREGRVGGADAASQVELHDQAAGLEPRRQPRDDRKASRRCGSSASGRRMRGTSRHRRRRGRIGRRRRRGHGSAKAAATR